MTKVTSARPELYAAMKTLMERVPALVADGRDSTVREVAQRLAAQGVPGASLVSGADAAAIAEVRTQLLRDVFTERGAPPPTGLSGDTGTPKARGTALVSGGSFTGMLAAIALARSGNQVTLVE